MRSTGVVRALDNLGRVVLPIEVRRSLGINDRDGLEIFTENEMILLRRYNPGCVICDSMDDMVTYKGKLLCRNCVEIIGDMK